MALISDVIIARMALTHVGARNTIESLSENSPEAKVCKLWYDPSRKQALEAFDWNFARKRQALAVHNDAPPEGVWLFRYQYPADCIAARRVENPVISATSGGVFTSEAFKHVVGVNPDAVPFEIETSNDGTISILTDLEDAILVYTFDLTNENLFPMMFVEAHSRVLAARIAFSLTAKRSIADDQFRMFLALVSAAEKRNANEQVQKPPRDAEWIRGR